MSICVCVRSRSIVGAGIIGTREVHGLSWPQLASPSRRLVCLVSCLTAIFFISSLLSTLLLSLSLSRRPFLSLSSQRTYDALSLYRYISSFANSLILYVARRWSSHFPLNPCDTQAQQTVSCVRPTNTVLHILPFFSRGFPLESFIDDITLHETPSQVSQSQEPPLARHRCWIDPRLPLRHRAMMRPPHSSWKALSLLALGTLPARVLGGDVLSTDGYTLCSENPSIKVNAMNVQYDRSTNIVTFDVSGTSTARQNVTAKIVVTAYGHQVYERSFDPCDEGSYVEKLCPGMSPPQLLLCSTVCVRVD